MNARGFARSLGAAGCLAAFAIAGTAHAEGCGDLLWLSEWMAPVLVPARQNDLPNTLGVAREDREKMTQGAVEAAPRTEKEYNRSAVAASMGVNSPFSSGRYLWLYRGDAPGCSTAAASGPPLEIVGEDEARGVEPLAGRQRFVAKFDLDKAGNYNVYASQAVVRDGTLDLQIAKVQTVRGGLREERVPDPAERPPVHDPGKAFELVRERGEGERFYTRLSPGDEVVFTVRSFGETVPGVPVSLVSQAGWRRTVVADAAGRVRFQLPRDDFTPRSEIRRSNWSTYVVSAEWSLLRAGEHDGAAYERLHLRTTLSGRYYPSPFEYRSQAIGLGAVAAVVALAAVATFLFRAFRARPFREVRFDELA